jgi:ATP-dependent helicase/nuclease subunit A
MRSPSIIPAAVLRLQSEVSDPSCSAWVAANAGSGKTHVLAQRVINLLLAGVEPEKILGITFTKAAAANMAKRVFDTLSRWTTLDDEALDAAIAERSGMPPDARRRALARRLFARALETPGGLKVQTIHAFCTQLLHQFPFEANVAARFGVLDDTAHVQLLEQITLTVLLEGAAAPDSALGRALATAMIAGADQTFRDVVREAIGRRDSIARWAMNAGGVEEAIAALSQTLGVDPSLTQAEVDAEIVDGSLLPPSEWAAVAALCKTSSVRDQEQAERLSQAANARGTERVEAYLKVFIDTNCKPRSNILTQSLSKKHPDLAQRLCEEQARVWTLRERRNAIICRERSAALVTVAYAVLTRYRAEKERRGLLDYDDLIDRTLSLLENVDAAWVHYKLDLGIDHVLIDEAQDTSAKQWEIITRLTAEFTAGKGARDLKRTIFAVGDEKQSIFSFQNAAPKEFALMRRRFQGAHADAGLGFVFHKFEHSFRSGDSVLGAVDEVFKASHIAASVTTDTDGFPPHIALPEQPSGMVEVWEPEKPDPRNDIEGWEAPFDTVNETSPRVKLAQRIARTVHGFVADGIPVGADRRPTRYGDVLILVRQRGPLFEAIIRALKNENVEVAGADRLVLTEHIAVMDLMVLADALLLPQDDLALATVLRSPLFGFSDEELFAIAWDRGRVSLRAALARKAVETDTNEQTKKFAAAAAQLEALTQLARRETPFAFYAHLLGAGGGRQRFLGRLGPEAHDALDEFLNLALDYERRETPSLQGFVAWLREARVEVKRDMEIARDEVRVMTVHGAKGLEAPIVILADTMTAPIGPRPPRLLELEGGAVVWAGRKDDDVPVVAASRALALAEAEHEYRRLLYVAMTRAADRLIICGADGERTRPKGCWYDLMRDALAPLLVEEADGGEKVFRYCKSADGGAAEPAAAPADVVKPPVMALPAWLRQSVAAQAARAVRLSPSLADEEESRAASGAANAVDRHRALARGRILHRLMQALPDIPAAGRKAAIEGYLARAGADVPADQQTELARQALTILNDLVFAEAFAPGSRAEVPIVGRIARGSGAPAIEVAGQVDRLAVTAEGVLIVDYKTDQAVPPRLDDVPKPYVTQLALYRAVLASIYPGKTIRAALIFTGGPSLVELPAAAMAAALAAIVRRVTRE